MVERFFINHPTIDGYKIGSDGKRLAAVSKFKGMDISHHSGDINFIKVKAAGISTEVDLNEFTLYIFR